MVICYDTVSKLCHDVLEIAVDANIDENLISLIFK